MVRASTYDQRHCPNSRSELGSTTHPRTPRRAHLVNVSDPPTNADPYAFGSTPRSADRCSSPVARTRATSKSLKSTCG